MATMNSAYCVYIHTSCKIRLIPMHGNCKDLQLIAYDVISVCLSKFYFRINSGRTIFIQNISLLLLVRCTHN